MRSVWTREILFRDECVPVCLRPFWNIGDVLDFLGVGRGKAWSSWEV